MNRALLDICMTDLFAEYADLQKKYSKDTVNSILRVRDMYLWVVKFPYLKDSDFAREDMKRYNVSRPTAYADLNLIKSLLPEISKSKKDFDRWRFTQMILDTYEIARIKKDVRTMERAAATYAKYTGLDKEEEEKLPLDKIIPQNFIPWHDPSIIGFKQMPREQIKAIEDKYLKQLPELADVEYEDADVEAYSKPLPSEESEAEPVI